MTQTHYHIVYCQDSQYRTLPVEDEYEVHTQIYNLSTKPRREVLGVYDTRDHQFHWHIEEPCRGEHRAKVVMICQAFDAF